MAPFVWVVRIAGSILLLIAGPAMPPSEASSDMLPPGPSRPRDEDAAGAPRAAWVEAEVEADRLDVLDQPEDSAYAVGMVRKGDRIRVRVDRIPKAGWLAVDPLPTSICWVDESSLEMDEDDAPGRPEWAIDPGGREPGGIGRAWVIGPRAVVRSGNLRARMPGPASGIVPRGTMVQLVDRPAVRLGQGPRARRWRAIVPPPDSVAYLRAEGVRWARPAPPEPPVAEHRASLEETITPSRGEHRNPAQQPAVPPEIASELERIDATYRAILASQPMERWRFEAVRVDYQALLKRGGDRPDVEEAIRGRLARLTRSEQAAQAARTIESILARSHRRDGEVARMKNRLTQLERTRARAYDAVGFVQPSARKVDGQKVYALIGRDGSAVAYLDIPPGLDPRPLLARRVGVRGRTHFSEELGTRLITVRDMEGIETTR